MTASSVREYITFSQMNINQNVFILFILRNCERQQNKNEPSFKSCSSLTVQEGDLAS